MTLAENGLAKEYEEYGDEILGKLQETQNKGKWQSWSYNTLDSLQSIFGEPEVNVKYSQKSNFNLSLT